MSSHFKNGRLKNLLLGLLILIILVVVVVVVRLQSLVFERLNFFGSETSSENIDDTNNEFVPLYTEEIKQQLEGSEGFQHLVSFTVNGFEPSELNVEVGETVRLTNNSSDPLWLTEVGVRSSDCNEENVDICRVIAPLEFTEITFDESTEWSYENRIDDGVSGSITVIVE